MARNKDRTPTRPLSAEFLGMVKKNLADAGIEQPQAEAVDQKAPQAGIKAHRESFRERVRRAARALVAGPRVDEADVSDDPITSFLAKADAFGVYNFQTAVLSPGSQKALNRFLKEKEPTISLGVSSYAEIPRDWLDKNGAVRDVFTDPQDYSRILLEALKRMGYQMEIQQNGQVSANYLTWLKVFEAMRLAAKYKKMRAGGK